MSEQAQPTDTTPTPEDAEKAKAEDKEALAALAALPARSFARLCRRVPLRTFMAELERLDRAVFYRHFKGYRPQKIDAGHLEKVLRKEMFERENALLAQLVIYNWDESEWRLYQALQKHVKTINEDVEAIEHITDEQATPIVEALEAEFDRRDVYTSLVINGVRVGKEFLAARYADLLA